MPISVVKAEPLLQFTSGGLVTANILRASVTGNQLQFRAMEPALHHPTLVEGNHLGGSVGAGAVGVTAVNLNTAAHSNVQQAISVHIEGLPPALQDALSRALPQAMPHTP